MPGQPLVSVVTCSYNNSRFVLDTLNSIREQTYDNIELIIVDDCSTDNSVALIDEWLSAYKGKYVFIRHPQNLGGSIPYNVGLRAATGKYYAAIDTDDVMMPEKIAVQVAMMEAAGEHVGGVYSDAELMDVDGVPLEGKFIQKHRQFATVPSGNIYMELLQGNYIPFMSLLIRRAVFDELGGYDESLVYGDYDMWLRIAEKYELLHSDYVSGRYRIRPGSLSNTIRNWGYTNARIMLKHVAAAIPMGWLNDIAWQAYISNDPETLPVIREIAVKKSDKVLMTSYLLWKLGIPVSAGGQVITSIHKDIADGASAQLINAGDSDAAIFVNEIAGCLSNTLLQSIIWEGCCSRNAAVVQLLEGLVSKGNIDLLRGMAFDAYMQERKEVMQCVAGLAQANHDRLVATACLLYRLHVSPAMGKSMLLKLQDPVQKALAPTITGKYASDIEMFLNEAAPLLQFDELKQMASMAYYSNNVLMLPFVRHVAKQTRNRYVQAILSLWKYKVNSYTGGIILDRVDGYCRQKRNRIYINLCVYKDIYHAIRTNNSSYFN